MKTCMTLAALILAALLTPKAIAQTAPSADAPAAPQAAAETSAKIDPTEEADIRKLLAMTGSTDVARQMMDNMQAGMKPMLLQSLPPGDYRQRLVDLFFEKFRAKADPQQIVDLTVRVYGKYLSDEDVKGLIQFYSTPLGQKAITVFPKLAAESQSEGMKWGQQVGQQAMIEVLTEHPDLAKAIQDAAKNAGGQ